MAFTTSGRSENVRRALLTAKRLELRTVAFLAATAVSALASRKLNYCEKYYACSRSGDSQASPSHDLRDRRDETLGARK